MFIQFHTVMTHRHHHVHYRFIQLDSFCSFCFILWWCIVIITFSTILFWFILTYNHHHHHHHVQYCFIQFKSNLMRFILTHHRYHHVQYCFIQFESRSVRFILTHHHPHHFILFWCIVIITFSTILFILFHSVRVSFSSIHSTHSSHYSVFNMPVVHSVLFHQIWCLIWLIQIHFNALNFNSVS
jgi:hypothetical protein